MLRYMRSSEAQGNGDGTGNGDSAGDGLNAGAHEASGGNSSQPSGTQQQAPTIHAPLPLHVRQQLAEAAKIPIPGPSRGASPSLPANYAYPPATSPRKLQTQPLTQPRRQGPFPRARSNSGASSNSYANPAHVSQDEQQIWEDSSINSMFAESVATATKPPQRVVNIGRYGSPFAQHRNQQQHRHERTTSENVDPIVEHGDGPYRPPSRTMPVVKPSKYALRDARGAARHSALPEGPPPRSYDDAKAGSPEQRAPQRRVSNPRRPSSALAGHAVPEPATEEPRAAALFTDARAPPERVLYDPETDRSDTGESDEAPDQHTPRQTRTSPRAPPPQQPPPALAHKRALQESSLPRVGASGSGHRDRKLHRKRRHTPDYDDSVLHSMSYAELRDEPFDHDPALSAGQAPAVPANLSIEDRLNHFKTKEATSQRHFFTEMSVREWDEAGDWFLAQFSELANKIREKRQAKRRKMAEFEAEITERENTVRLKAESIERTLGDLKQEGEGMMRNKVVDF